MTTVERNVLERIEGKIDQMDGRLREVEQTISAMEARDCERQRSWEAFASSRRWVIGLTISAALGAASLTFALAKAIGA